MPTVTVEFRTSHEYEVDLEKFLTSYMAEWQSWLDDYVGAEEYDGTIWVEDFKDWLYESLGEAHLANDDALVETVYSGDDTTEMTVDVYQIEQFLRDMGFNKVG